MRRSTDSYYAKHLRRAKKAGAEGTFDQYDVRLRFNKQRGKCHYCGEALESFGPKKFQVDHFIPLSRGGSNFAINIVCACPGCNLAKSNKLPWEYRPALFSEGCGRDA